MRFGALGPLEVTTVSGPVRIAGVRQRTLLAVLLARSGHAVATDDLVDAIERVREGDAVFSPRLAGFVLDAFRDGAPAEVREDDLDQLTPREREVLQHIARGYLYKEIGQRLGISVKTVEAHVSAVLRKLQLSTRHELTRWAWERLDPPEEGNARW